MYDQKIIELFKSGMKRKEIARTLHIQDYVVEQTLKNFPTYNFTKKVESYPGFKDWFINLYNSTDSMKEIVKECENHDIFKKAKGGINQRISELRRLWDLEPKSFQRDYECQYDRIRGYIIRNSKYMAKRRGIEFDLEYTDFELPKYCPLTGIELEYGAGKDGQAPQHASLDRIDNSKGYIKGNVMVVSRLGNAMKNGADFDQLKYFSKNCGLLADYMKIHGALGNITDVFPQ